MTPLALIFLGLSWSCVLGLTAWAFYRVLRADSRHDGPAGDPGGRPGGLRRDGTEPGHDGRPE